MNISQLKKLLTKTIPAKLPVMVKGAPGIGKTDAIAQVAEAIGYELIVMHPVISDPTDFKGLPCVVDGGAEFLPFGDLRRLVEADKPTICFLDDLGQAPMVVQAAAMQLILARQINGTKISDKVVFLAATNRREDRAGVSSIIEPLKSRFACIVELTVDVNEWAVWATQNNIPSELIGFAYYRPELLNTPSSTNDIVNSPSPRTYAFVGKLMQSGIDSMEVIAGAIGEKAAVEFEGFRRIYKNLPDLDTIINNPEKADTPADTSVMYAVVGAIVSKLTTLTSTQKNNVIKYALRLPAEVSALLVHQCLKHDSSITNTEAFVEWALKNKNTLLNN